MFVIVTRGASIDGAAATGALPLGARRGMGGLRNSHGSLEVNIARGGEIPLHRQTLRVRRSMRRKSISAPAELGDSKDRHGQDILAVGGPYRSLSLKGLKARTRGILSMGTVKRMLIRVVWAVSLRLKVVGIICWYLGTTQKMTIMTIVTPTTTLRAGARKCLNKHQVVGGLYRRHHRHHLRNLIQKKTS